MLHSFTGQYQFPLVYPLQIRRSARYPWMCACRQPSRAHRPASPPCLLWWLLVVWLVVAVEVMLPTAPRRCNPPTNRFTGSNCARMVQTAQPKDPSRTRISSATGSNVPHHTAPGWQKRQRALLREQMPFVPNGMVRRSPTLPVGASQNSSKGSSATRASSHSINCCM